MDVQGFGLKVIEGAARMIQSNRVRFIFAEVGFRPNDLEIQMFGDFNTAMADRGFMFSGFYDFLRYATTRNLFCSRTRFTQIQTLVPPDFEFEGQIGDSAKPFAIKERDLGLLRALAGRP